MTSPQQSFHGFLTSDLDAWPSAELAPVEVEATRRVEAVVVALIPEYQQVKVRDGEGHLYALTPRTAGVHLDELRHGQRVQCVVTMLLPRVLSAHALA